MDYIVGMFLGFLLGVSTSVLFWAIHTELHVTPLERDYEAYRVCIKQHDCVMTPDDYINYYRIKWRLDEAHRKESGQDE